MENAPNESPSKKKQNCGENAKEKKWDASCAEGPEKAFGLSPAAAENFFPESGKMERHFSADGGNEVQGQKTNDGAAVVNSRRGGALALKSGHKMGVQASGATCGDPNAEDPKIMSKIKLIFAHARKWATVLDLFDQQPSLLRGILSGAPVQGEAGIALVVGGFFRGLQIKLKSFAPGRGFAYGFLFNLRARRGL